MDLKGKKHVSNTFRTAIIIVMATILLVCVSEPVHVAGQDSTLKKNSNWSKQTTNPIILDPSVEISIINKCSSPEKGENWTVNFITKGRADLKIIPNDEKTIIDDEFVGLYCGDQKVEPQILEGDIIYYPNWECEETARVVHYTLTRSHHTLRFEFGREKDYAYNDCNSACYHNPSTKNCDLANPTCSCSYGYKKIIHCLQESCGKCGDGKGVGGCGDYFAGCPHTCSGTRDDYIQITRVCCPNCDASDTYVCSGGDVYFRNYYCDTQQSTSSASDAVFCNYADTLYDSCDGYEERNNGCQYREETCSGGSCVWGDWTNQNEGGWCGSTWEACYDSGSCDVRTYRHKCSSGSCTGTYEYSTGCSTCTACNGQDCGTCCECSGETRTYDPTQDGDCSATNCYTGNCGGLDSCAVYSGGQKGTCGTCYYCNDADPACDLVGYGSDPNGDCAVGSWSCDGSCRLQRNSGNCNGAGACLVNDEKSNCAYGTACSAGVCGSGTYCSGTDHCSGNTRYTGYSCNGNNVCNVDKGDIGCCQGNYCPSTDYCKEADYSCHNINTDYTCAERNENDFGVNPQESSEDLWGECGTANCYTGNCAGGSYACGVYSNGEQGSCNSCYECNDADASCDEITFRSSDWNVDCSDNCVISSNVDMNGYSLLFSGSGTFNVNADITDFNIVSISSGCRVSIANGYKLG